MTSGVKHLLLEASLWLSTIIFTFAFVFYFQEISELLGLREAPSYAANYEADEAEDDEPLEAGFERTERLRSHSNGHFFTEARINGRRVSVLVDTGATLVSLSYEDAEKIGFHLSDADFKYQTRTANGIARSAHVMLHKIRIGDIVVRDVEASVAEKGKIPITLLGMSFLGQLKSVNLSSGELILTQ